MDTRLLGKRRQEITPRKQSWAQRVAAASSFCRGFFVGPIRSPHRAVPCYQPLRTDWCGLAVARGQRPKPKTGRGGRGRNERSLIGGEVAATLRLERCGQFPPASLRDCCRRNSSSWAPNRPRMNALLEPRRPFDHSDESSASWVSLLAPASLPGRRHAGWGYAWTAARDWDLGSLGMKCDAQPAPALAATRIDALRPAHLDRLQHPGDGER